MIRSFRLALLALASIPLVIAAPDAAAAEGKLRIVCYTANAVVEIDGKEIGKCRMKKTHTVEAGTRQLRVWRDGYKDFIENVEVKEGRKVKKTIRLKKAPRGWERPPVPPLPGAEAAPAPTPEAPKTGSVLIDSEDEGATIEVDGRPAGTVPLSAAIELPAGAHRLRVLKAGYVTFDKEITVEAGGTASLVVTLAKEAAAVAGADAAPATDPAPGADAATPSSAGWAVEKPEAWPIFELTLLGGVGETAGDHSSDVLHAAFDGGLRYHLQDAVPGLWIGATYAMRRYDQEYAVEGVAQGRQPSTRLVDTTELYQDAAITFGYNVLQGITDRIELTLGIAPRFGSLDAEIGHRWFFAPGAFASADFHVLSRFHAYCEAGFAAAVVGTEETISIDGLPRFITDMAGGIGWDLTLAEPRVTLMLGYRGQLLTFERAERQYHGIRGGLRLGF